MALKTFVKISEVNNLSDARYCAAMGVDQLGFNAVQGQPRYLSSEKFAEITGWVAGVAFVGEFGRQSAEYAAEMIPSYKFDYIETARVDLLEDFSRLALPVILALNIDECANEKALDKLLDYARHTVEYFLVYSQNEEESRHRLQEITALSKRYPLVLGSWVNSQNILELLTQTGLKGISLKGGTEIKVGYKDFDELADVLEKIEE